MKLHNRRVNMNDEVDVVNGCYIDMLVDVIDDKVEKVDNYKERVKKEYL